MDPRTTEERSAVATHPALGPRMPPSCSFIPRRGEKGLLRGWQCRPGACAVLPESVHPDTGEAYRSKPDHAPWEIMVADLSGDNRRVGAIPTDPHGVAQLRALAQQRGIR